MEVDGVVKGLLEMAGEEDGGKVALGKGELEWESVALGLEERSVPRAVGRVGLGVAVREGISVRLGEGV